MRKILYTLMLLALLLLPAVPAHASSNGLHDGRGVIGQDYTLKSGDTITGDLVTVGGSMQRAEGSKVGGNVVTNLPPPSINVPLTPRATIPPVPPKPSFEVLANPFSTAAGIFM